MIKLSQHQIAILASADADGFAIRPADLKPSAAAKVVAKLIEHKLVREVRSKGDAPIWREGEDGRFSLKILKAGQAALQAALEGPVGAVASRSKSAGSKSRDSASADAGHPAKGQTKRALILSLMSRADGATLDELVAATNWLPHTTRAALTGLRKSGVELERGKRGDASVYRVIAPALGAAA